MKKELEFVKEEQKKLILLKGISALLDWDTKIYMPENALESRSLQMSLISEEEHKIITSEKLYSSVKKLKKDKLEKYDKIMIDRLYKGISKSRKLPIEFIKELEETSIKANKAWEKAKNKKDFSIFQPYLEKIVNLKIQEAKYYNFPGNLYNGLMDSYEEGMTVEKMTPVFEKLRNDLIILINDIKKSPQYNKRINKIKSKKWSIEKQKKFNKFISLKMGLDSKESYNEIYMHPFTSPMGFKDVRITTHYSDNPLQALFATIHESGHALYELGFSDKFKYTVLHDAPSHGIHESQSRFWENNIARSPYFLRYLYRKFKIDFPKEMKGISFKDFYREVNNVSPSLIRIFADEVTYCLHIILRFEIEVALINGKLKVKDLPSYWNNKMKEFFGITPKNDSEGVLQDVHWSFGDFGYFASYAIGSIYASQLFFQMIKENPKIMKEVERGELSKVLKWLRENVHHYGSTLLADEIVKKSTGKGLDSEAFIKYLREKYSKIYRI